MRPIVAAIDFSNTSIHALEYAINLANKMRSDIILIWVDKVNPQESVYPDTSNENKKEARKRFEELIAEYRPHLIRGLTMDYRLKRGRIHKEVDSLARLLEADLVIAGAHGISGFEEYWIGSNAYKIVSCSNCPVITIRNDFPIRKSIGKILLPVDGSEDTLQKVPFIVTLASLFKSEVHMITIHTSNLKSIQRLAEKVAQKASSYIRKHEISVIEESIVTTDPTKALLEHAVKGKVDLLAIMTEQETPAKKLLGPHAQQLINQSPVPVLSIHPREKFIFAE